MSFLLIPSFLFRAFFAEEAENGKEAVGIIQNSVPGEYTAVLMDVQMPVMNGYEATKAIRHLPNEKLAAIPILAMTANAFEEDKKQAFEHGMNGHIAKPIDIKLVIFFIFSCLFSHFILF